MNNTIPISEVTKYIKKNEIDKKIRRLLKKADIRKAVKQEQERFAIALSGNEMDKFRPKYNEIIQAQIEDVENDESFTQFLIIVTGALLFDWDGEGKPSIHLRDAARKAVNIRIFTLFIALMILEEKEDDSIVPEMISVPISSKLLRNL